MAECKCEVEDLFKDAEVLQKDALEMLAAGKLRNAAEKAWGATVKATQGLVAAKTGEEPSTSTGARIALEKVARQDKDCDTILSRFFSRQASLHGGCFYDGVCEPADILERRIRETEQLIKDARGLAGCDGPGTGAKKD